MKEKRSEGMSNNITERRNPKTSEAMNIKISGAMTNKLSEVNVFT